MRTILFDIDGTLISLKGVGRRALDRAIVEHWGIEHALEGMSFAGATDRAILRGIGGARPIEALLARYTELLAEDIARLDDAAPLAGVTALLDALSARGARLGLLTGNVRAGAHLKLGAVGLFDRFDPAISAFGDDGVARPEIAAVAADRAGTPLTIVGDSVADANAARHVGARVLLTATGPEPRSVLAATGADRIVDDLRETDALVAWLLDG